MRLHVIGLPMTQTTSEFSTCPYTQNLLGFTKMMTGLGHEVVVYAGDENEAACTEIVTCVSRREQEEWFGPYNPNSAITDATSTGWKAEDAEWWAEMNRRVLSALLARGLDPDEDIVCVTAGVSQQMITDTLAVVCEDVISAEWNVGYEGVVRRHHWCFPSHAWQHYVYGVQGVKDGRWYDTVIPHAVDPADFIFEPEPGTYDDEPYLLFMGRLVGRKGAQVAADISERVGMKLVVAGPGALHDAGEDIVTVDGMVRGSRVVLEGAAGKERRAELLAGASALLMPTLYPEPFGLVAVEAMMSGTPVVASPWGAFTETISEGVSGFTFHTLGEAVARVQDAMTLDRGGVRAWAERYAPGVIAPEYDRWFQRLMGLRGAGWGA
jgi:glycosyltransferase involved in cell wall biosynthesis